MSTLADIQSRFRPEPKAAWHFLHRDRLVKTLDLRSKAIEQRQQEEREGLERSKPSSYGDPGCIVAWKQESARLTDRHLQEIETEDQEAQRILAEYEELTLQTVAAYGTHFSIYEQLLKKAWGSIQERIAKLLNELIQFHQSEDAITGRLDDKRIQVNTQLSQVDAPCAFGEGIDDGWQDDLREALFRQAASVNGVDPDSPPLVGARPPLTLPIPVSEEAYTLDKSKTSPLRGLFANLMMLIAGIAFGASIGAAIGAIHFDSKGWHYETIFWYMLAVGEIGSYMAGTILFPLLAGMAMIDTIDETPYLKDDPAHVKGRNKAALGAVFAALMIFLIFTCYIGVDFFGWFRAASEHNAAVAGDDGAFIVNPWTAGLFVSFLSSFLASIKLGDVIARLKKIKRQIENEVGRNAILHCDRVAEYRDRMTAFEKEQKVLKEYEETIAMSRRNAQFRLSDIVRHVAPFVGEYQSVRAELGSDPTDRVEKAIDATVHTALLECEEARQRVESLKTRIDQGVFRICEICEEPTHELEPETSFIVGQPIENEPLVLNLNPSAVTA